MQADIVKIGNSRGIRLPAAVLKQCGIGSKVELEVVDSRIILKPIKRPRQGWAAALKKMHQHGLDADLLEDDE